MSTDLQRALDTALLQLAIEKGVADAADLAERRAAVVEARIEAVRRALPGS